jgi:Raf kinase inhibitor-like YbhB/YbcL family protein
MRLTSPSFRYGRMIPARHTGDGDGVSPHLEVTGIPEAATAMALICEDPDVEGGTFVHWVAFDFGPEDAISEGVADLGTPGLNSWRRTGYGPPRPPFGIHRYLFRVFALAEALRLPERSTALEVRDAMRDRVLAEAVLMGRYGR